MVWAELSEGEREVFRDRGLVRLRRWAPGGKTTRAREAVLAELTRLGARVAGKWNVARFPKKLGHLPELDELFPVGLDSSLSALGGIRLVRAEPNPQLLLTPPQAVSWSLPYLGWHLDVASPTRDELPGIQVFVLVDDVAPRGGGTVAVAGSHRLHGPHGGLQADPFMANLFKPSSGDRERFSKPHTVGGVVVQVVEMCGDAGDAYLMDMRTLHAAAPNASKRPRMMVTRRFLSDAPKRR